MNLKILARQVNDLMYISSTFPLYLNEETILEIKELPRSYCFNGWELVVDNISYYCELPTMKEYKFFKYL